MSYCRWSSGDFQCDVYVYEDVAGGWTTHVAGNRMIPKQPIPAQVSIDDMGAWMARHKEVSRILDEADRVKIGLDHDGESFSDDSPGECADRLEYLRGLGYMVPQYAIDELREEAA